MTAAAITPVRPGARLAGRIPFGPAEGWVTVASTAVMVLAVGWSFQDAAWAPGPASDGGFLPWVAFAGFATGLLGAKVGWGRWRTHVVGALFAGIVLALITGGIALEHRVGWDPRALAERLVAALGVVQGVWQDLAVRGLAQTQQSAHYHLFVGGVVWAAGMLAGYTVFGHHRPLDAVVVLGLVLLADMAVLDHNQLTILIAFSTAALLLLIRTHVFEEQLVWARRRIGDPAVVGQLYLRGGAAFVAAAVLGSVLLTSTASSAPLQGLWQDLPRTLKGMTEFLQRFVPPDADYRGPNVPTFGRSATTLGRWSPADAIAFTAQLRPSETRIFKWRAGTYSTYTLSGWDWGTTLEQPTAPRDPLLRDSADVREGNRRSLFAQVHPEAFRDPTILGPATLQEVDRSTTSFLLGDDHWYVSVESTENSDIYNVTGSVPVFQDVPGGITQARLRQAGNDYDAVSPELLALYGPSSLPEGSLGPNALRLLDDIKAAVRVPDGFDPENAFDLAATMEAYFQDSGNFQYSTDITDLRRLQCGGISTVECFATIRQGFCVYYAGTMTVLLRAAGVPARVAYGFLPGERDASNLETVSGAAEHWWVEVYFPGTGWVEFDPTGGGVGQPETPNIPEGSVGPPTPAPSRPGPTFRDTETDPPDGQVNPPTGSGGTNIGPFIAITFILLIGVAALALAALRRTPNKPMHPDQAWGSVARLAARLGLGPKPSQTVYEYAGALADAVPDARVELTTIARAKVEVAYGKRDLGSDRLKGIARAYQRLRLALLSVLVRRGLRRARRR